MKLHRVAKVSLRLHLTNIAGVGVGATQLVQSLLPALEQQTGVTVTEIHLPDKGVLASYKKSGSTCHVINYKRWLPNAISRLVECLVLSRYLKGEDPVFVLGDLPLRCQGSQTVFVQSSHICRPQHFRWQLGHFKLTLARIVFRLNARYASAFIVQTNVMKNKLATSYPSIADRIHVVAQPVPEWLLESGLNLKRDGLKSPARNNLTLIYPAADYAHKNHKILSQIDVKQSASWPISKLKLTLGEEKNPAPDLSWIECAGFLSSEDMINAYENVDALLFLSTDESYGFPLVEAMYVGLPIVCPDLPYARTLCAGEAIYFDPQSIDSLRCAIGQLQSKLESGWWPDWSEQLSKIPTDWNIVARAMIDVACSSSVRQENRS